MNSTTIDHNASADLQGPSTELNHNTEVNTPPSISVRYADIPPYLHRSEFYLSLDSNEEDSLISIPANCLWAGGTIGNSAEFCQYLQTLNFWGVGYVTLDGLKFMFPSNLDRSSSADAFDFTSACMKLVDDICGANSILQEAIWCVLDEITCSAGYRYAIDQYVDPWHVEPHSRTVAIKIKIDMAFNAASLPKVFCRSVVRAGKLDDLIALHVYHGEVIWDKETCAMAARFGNIDCLKYMINHGCGCDFKTGCAAAIGGHLHILQYMHASRLGFDAETNAWPPMVATCAASGGNIECLGFIHAHGLSWDDSAWLAPACKGNLEVLQYLYDNLCPWTEEKMSSIAEFGELNSVQFMVQRGSPIPTNACVIAAKRDDAEVIQLFHELGCTWNGHESHLMINWAAGRAAEFTKIKPLRYAVEHGCPLPENVLCYVIDADNENSEDEKLTCLKYLIEEQMQEMTPSLFSSALAWGHLECVKYLIDVGCPLSTDEHGSWMYRQLIHADADQVHLCLVYAIERGWQFDMDMKYYFEGKVKFARSLEYLRSEGLLKRKYTDYDEYYSP